jgi:hypothetical protein
MDHYPFAYTLLRCGVDKIPLAMVKLIQNRAIKSRKLLKCTLFVIRNLTISVIIRHNDVPFVQIESICPKSRRAIKSE